MFQLLVSSGRWHIDCSCVLPKTFISSGCLASNTECVVFVENIGPQCQLIYSLLFCINLVIKRLIVLRRKYDGSSQVLELLLQATVGVFDIFSFFEKTIYINLRVFSLFSCFA